MTYNGWLNYETWSVSLWLQNTEELYAVALRCKTWSEYVQAMNDLGQPKNGDGVSWSDPAIDIPRMNELLCELQ